MSSLASRDSVRSGKVRSADGPDHVEPYDRPTEAAKLVVDVEYQSAIAPTTFGRSGLLGSASFRATTIQNDFYRRIVHKGAPEIAIELLAIMRDHDKLLRDCQAAFGERMELGHKAERPLVKESGQRNRGTPAARGARGRSEEKAGLTIEAKRQAAKR